MTNLPDFENLRIAVIGLGYVGLPLAIEFGKKHPVVGFDINQQRITDLSSGHDSTLENSPEELNNSHKLILTADPQRLADCNVYIVTVPTPIDDARRPDLGHLLAASKTVGQLLAPGNVVIYESTVYPGCTEQDCAPILERESGLTCANSANSTHADNSDTTSDSASDIAKQRQYFYLGYSPERINPGDKKHRLADVVKITSGSTAEAADFVDQLYASIVSAGTHKTSSIRVAEAAKVIENTQRDVNIGLVNELAMLFSKLGIDTGEVLEAAGTKWNFLPFKPGLVGGHCLGVDPYYLTHKAQQVGFHPQMILAGRRTNDDMGHWVAGEVIKLMASKNVYQSGGRVLVLGLTFKENCPDLRNTLVTDVISGLSDYQLQVDVHDPWASATEAEQRYALKLCERPEANTYDAVVLAVAHREFEAMDVRSFVKNGGVIYDLKHTLPADEVDGRL